MLALYLLKRHLGVPRPTKKRVLDFIRLRRLMHIPDADKALRSTGEPIWENDLAWKREDLSEAGFLRMPEHGIWEITDRGELEVVAWARKVDELASADPNWRERISKHLSEEQEESDDFEIVLEYYITVETVEWGVKIAQEQRQGEPVRPDNVG